MTMTETEKGAHRQRAHDLMEEALVLLTLTSDNFAATHLDHAIETLALRPHYRLDRRPPET